MVQLLFFGQFSDISEGGEVSLPDHVTDTEKLVFWLGETQNGFNEIWESPGTSIVLNHEILSETKTIKPADEIAFLSPLSGG